MSGDIKNFRLIINPNPPEEAVPFVDRLPYLKLYSCLFNGITDIINTIDKQIPGHEKTNPPAENMLFVISESLKELQCKSEEIFMGVRTIAESENKKDRENADAGAP